METRVPTLGRLWRQKSLYRSILSEDEIMSGMLWPTVFSRCMMGLISISLKRSIVLFWLNIVKTINVKSYDQLLTIEDVWYGDTIIRVWQRRTSGWRVMIHPITDLSNSSLNKSMDLWSANVSIVGLSPTSIYIKTFTLWLHRSTWSLDQGQLNCQIEPHEIR